MKQFLAFVRKEFYHVFRDPKTMLMLFGMPIMLIVLFGFALTNEIKNSRIAICDYAKDEASQRIITKLGSNPDFIIEEYLSGADQVEVALRKGRIKLAVVFPANFNENLHHFNRAEVQIIADASDPNTATTLANYATSVIRSYQNEITEGARPAYQIATEVRMLYNPELKGATNFVPGVMALVLLLVCVLMTSVSIVKEKETGTMEVLLVSPVNPFLVILSKAVPYFLLSLVNLTVILALSIFLLQMPMNGSFLLLFAESSVLILASLSLGLLISNITDSQQSAMLISLMGMLIPTLLLTGFLFPLENMPMPLQIVANAIPSRWYYIIVKSIMIKGLGFAAIWKETLILIGMTVVLLLLSFKKFKIRLS